MFIHNNYLRKVAANSGAYCRCCDSKLPKGTDMISFYSMRERGVNVHLCISCCKEINKQVVLHIRNEKET